MNVDLFGKNALVSGSSRGIGKASAIQLASLGANVTLVSRSPEVMSNIIKEMDMDIDKGQDHDFLAADFSDSEDLQRKVKALSLKRPYHILVNNTVIADSQREYNGNPRSNSESSTHTIMVLYPLQIGDQVKVKFNRDGESYIHSDRDHDVHFTGRRVAAFPQSQETS